MAASRKLVQVDQPGSIGWSCSECAWKFDPSQIPSVKSFDEMTLSLILEREKAFESHICSERPRAKPSSI
jgi:hypothetical protein